MDKMPMEASNWERVVDLVQMAFGEGRPAEENTWQEVVLIPKGGKEYRGIGLVEVMWKLLAEVLNRWLTASIIFHDFLHGFWAGRGTGTTTLEEKLIQQLAALREVVLYVILLDLHKAYGALDKSSCIDTLEGYGVVPREFRLLRTYWSRLKMVVRAGGYYRAALTGDWGVTQVDQLPPTIFNVVVDTVVSHWVSVIRGRPRTNRSVRTNRNALEWGCRPIEISGRPIETSWLCTLY